MWINGTISLLIVFAFLSAVGVAAESRQTLSFNSNWRFYRVDRTGKPEAFRPASADKVAEGEFSKDASAKEVRFTKAEGRYVCLESLSSQARDPFASLAELDVLDADGKPLPRNYWAVVYADSEETPGDAASNVLDGDPKSMWHTGYSISKPPHPHSLVIDMKAMQEVSGFRCLPRQNGGPGMIKSFRFYLRKEPFDTPGDPALSGPSYEATSVDDAAWEKVTLPHTPRLEALYERLPWQGICWYRKTLNAEPAWRGRKVFLDLGAAMQITDVWFNGVHKTRHLGGYMKFQLDLTADLRFDAPNLIAIRLDNRDTNQCPPGKPTLGLDFNYPGGLYRGATLLVTSPLHVSDAVAANIEAGGGVFVSYEDVSEDSATVKIKTHVVDESGMFVRRCEVHSVLTGADGKTVAEGKSFPVMIAAGEGHHFNQSLKVAKPRLWHPDHPSLYTLTTTVYHDGAATDEVQTRIGIRHIAVKNGFYLNGEKIHIIGSNRHQEYPYIGYALSPQASRRDAVKIKEAGLNHIRLSHYPHDPAFLDACDELGIMVQAPIPGWQQFWFNDSFIRQSFQDVRDLLHRDRNHPCVIFWEPNLNETDAGHADWCRAAHEICHAEYPGDQCLTFGDPYPKKPGWAWDVRDFAREYGDFSFGGNESTSRHLRGEGEKAMLQQTWNFLWCLNDMNRSYIDPKSAFLGSATWCMFDYDRGYYPKPCTCGMMDIFRLPKFEYEFFRSQRDPAVVRPDIDSGPMVFIANEWTPRASPAKVVVFSNCDEIELKVNGKAIRRQKGDAGADTRYSGMKNMSYETTGVNYETSGGNPFDGGNAKHLPHAPFTFGDVPYEEGTLEAIGYLRGAVAAHHTVQSPTDPASIKLVFDTARNDFTADGADVIFVRALVLDKNGTVVPNASNEITFSAEGPAKLVGRNPMPAEAGIASILLQADETPGKIKITAAGAGLRGDVEDIASSGASGPQTRIAPR